MFNRGFRSLKVTISTVTIAQMLPRQIICMEIADSLALETESALALIPLTTSEKSNKGVKEPDSPLSQSRLTLCEPSEVHLSRLHVEVSLFHIVVVVVEGY